MATLLIPLVGPLQSWGLDARFDLRQTASEPSKSGVLGLLCCCLGRDRNEPIDDLAELRFGVRIDRAGVLIRDFHTALNVVGSGDSKTRTVVSNRWYLCDAAIWAGFQGDRALLQQLHQALIHPHWTPCLGRRSCLPSMPLAGGGVVDTSLMESLRDAAPLDQRTKQFRLVVEDPAGTQVRPDQPLAPFSQRRFGVRRICTVTLPAPAHAS
jgi:CRISPR system Cascade subunit CasD